MDGWEERTTDADPRPPVKGQILPRKPQALGGAVIEPALRPERSGVVAVVVCAAVHCPQHPEDHRALRHEDGRGLVVAAAAGQDGVDEGGTVVGGDDGVEAEALVNEGAEVFHVLKGFEGQRVVAEGGHFGLEAGPDVRSAGELEHDVGEEGGGGVAAGHQHVQEFRPDPAFVACLRRELVQEDVAGGRGVGFGSGGVVVGEAFGDECVDVV